jgi:hypothetical protein
MNWRLIRIMSLSKKNSQIRSSEQKLRRIMFRRVNQKQHQRRMMRIKIGWTTSR